MHRLARLWVQPEKPTEPGINCTPRVSSFSRPRQKARNDVSRWRCSGP
uniref:Uncharacterized protein n=1 Tax=Arundo donax TaxID=35708 RepID=A0A0A9CDD0_ARUDO